MDALGAEWVQIDEPAFVSDRTDDEREALRHAYRVLAGVGARIKIPYKRTLIAVGESYEALTYLPVQAIGLDFVHGREANCGSIRSEGFPER